MGKIYCENCIYISSTGWFCKKEKQAPIMEDNYLHKKVTQYYVHAETKNAKNNCKDFTPNNFLKKLFNWLGV